MKNLGLVIIMLFFFGVLSSCSAQRLEIIKFSISASEEGFEYYAIYPENISDFKVFNNKEELYDFFRNDKFVLLGNFDQEIDKLENENFFSNYSLVCLIIQTGTGDSITVTVDKDENKYLNLKYTIIRGEEEGLEVRFLFTKFNKEYIEKFSNIDYEVLIK